jgi:hypothetical protein
VPTLRHSTADQLGLAKLERIRGPIAFCITTFATRSGGTAQPGRGSAAMGLVVDSSVFLTNDDLECRPNFADGTNLDIDKAQRQGHVPDSAFGNVGCNFR